MLLVLVLATVALVHSAPTSDAVSGTYSIPDTIVGSV